MSAFLNYWRSGGPLMFPLAMLCFFTWLWITVLYLRLRGMLVASGELDDRLHHLEVSHCSSGAAAVRPAENGGLFRRVVDYAAAPGLSPDDIRRRCNEVRMAELPVVEREFFVLKSLVAAAPLLGLLGTVMGMISTFIAMASRGTIQMDLLSAGISEAMVTTQAGLVIALPGLFGAHAVSRRLQETAVLLDRVESHLLTRRERSGRTRPAPSEGGV